GAAGGCGWKDADAERSAAKGGLHGGGGALSRQAGKEEREGRGECGLAGDEPGGRPFAGNEGEAARGAGPCALKGAGPAGGGSGVAHAKPGGDGRGRAARLLEGALAGRSRQADLRYDSAAEGVAALAGKSGSGGERRAAAGQGDARDV